jgi:hypothetical protein
MAFVVAPSRNKIVQAAFAGLERERRAEKKASKSVEKPEVAHPKDDIVRSEAYRRLVAARPCKNCGRHKRSQAAHVPPEGKGIKVDDRETFPLCCDGPRYKGCHPKFDQYELMPRDKAVKQGRKWAAETRAEIQAEGLWPKNLPKPGKKR